MFAFFLKKWSKVCLFYWLIDWLIEYFICVYDATVVSEGLQNLGL